MDSLFAIAYEFTKFCHHSLNATIHKVADFVQMGRLTRIPTQIQIVDLAKRPVPGAKDRGAVHCETYVRFLLTGSILPVEGVTHGSMNCKGF
jgi:hypothetical protein